MRDTGGNARLSMKIERELMRGAGPTAVLQLLAGGEKYGYELVEALARQSNGVLAMGQSTLYPLLYNLEAKGLVTSRVDESGPRPRRFYRLTSKGHASWRPTRSSGNRCGTRCVRWASRASRPGRRGVRDDGGSNLSVASDVVHALARCVARADRR